MKKIELTRGYFALVDDEDFEEINKHSWCVAISKNKKNIYAKRGSYNSKEKKSNTIRMHRLILGAKKGQQVDHINGNGLDNRRSNIRIVTAAENARNRKCNSSWRGKKRYSKFKGITKNNNPKKAWSASICLNGYRIHIGVFETEIEAAKAYNIKAMELFGSFAYLNTTI